MLDVFKPEIVSVCTPTDTHAEIVKHVAGYDCVKKIFLEKPIAQSLREADEIISACNEADIKLTVNYSRRWATVYNTLCGNLDSAVEVNLVGLHPGPLVRTGTHMIDLFNWVAATLKVDWEQVTVQAFGAPFFADYMQDTEDFNLNGFINYQKAAATLFGAFDTGGVLFELDAMWKGGRARVTDNGHSMYLYELRKSKRYDNLKEYEFIHQYNYTEDNMLLNAVTDVVNQGETLNGPGYVYKIMLSRCSGIDAKRALQVALALHYSATHGNKLLKLTDLPYNYTVKSH